MIHLRYLLSHIRNKTSFSQLVTDVIGFDYRVKYYTNMITYLLTYLLTPWSRVLLEKLTGSAASQEIPRILGN